VCFIFLPLLWAIEEQQRIIEARIKENQKPVMKIEAGKEYRTRDGGKARVYATDGAAPRPIHGATHNRCGHWSMTSWHEDGSSYRDRLWDVDIISEWKDEPVIPDNFWSEIVPFYVNYIAQSASGAWSGYENEPRMMKGTNCYNEWTGYSMGIPSKYAPIFSGEPKDSLLKRP